MRRAWPDGAEFALLDPPNPGCDDTSSFFAKCYNLPAKRGIYSIMASLTLHFVSSANSTIAGRRDWESCWMPMTSLTQSKLEMMFSLTSGHSSFNWFKNKGSKCSIVLKREKWNDQLSISSKQTTVFLRHSFERRSERRSFSRERNKSVAQFFKKERKVRAIHKNW